MKQSSWELHSTHALSCEKPPPREQDGNSRGEYYASVDGNNHLETGLKLCAPAASYRKCAHASFLLTLGFTIRLGQKIWVRGRWSRLALFRSNIIEFVWVESWNWTLQSANCMTCGTSSHCFLSMSANRLFPANQQRARQCQQFVL